MLNNLNNVEENQSLNLHKEKIPCLHMILKIELLILSEQMLLEIIQGLVLLRSNAQGQFTAVDSVRWTAARLCFHSPCSRKQMRSEVNLRENRT